MASPPRKKRNAAPVPLETPDNTESSSESSDEELSEEGEEDAGHDINVDFKARTPEEFDHDGIVMLLKQQFRQPCTVDLSALANHIIGQRFVGSVVTTDHDQGEEEDEDDDDAMFDENQVVALGTMVRLGTGERLANDVATYISNSCLKKKASANDDEVLKFFSSASNRIGLLISERIMSLPPHVTIPLFSSLQNEMAKARAKNLPFDFTHIAMISKQLVPRGAGAEAVPMYLKAEEETIAEECDWVFDFSHNDEDSALVDFAPKRKLFVFKADKFDTIIARLKVVFPFPNP